MTRKEAAKFARLEKRRHEPSNAAAMREALKRLLNLAYEVQDLNSEDGPKTSVPTQFIIEVTKSALAAPPRQCDVGTPEEQAERYEVFCLKYFAQYSSVRPCSDCPFAGQEDSCQFAWAQMPYEEGGAV